MIKKENQNQIQSKNRPILKINKFQNFVEWYALPDAFREPKTQREFALQNNLNETTLVKWKKRTEFREGVERILKNWTWDKNRNVISAIYKSALEGNAASQRLWAEWQMRWIPKQEIAVDDRNERIRKNIEYLKLLSDETREKLLRAGEEAFAEIQSRRKDAK